MCEPPNLRIGLKRLNCNNAMPINSFLQRLPGGSALTNAKDRLLSKRAAEKLNKSIQRYGSMLDFRLNTVDKSVFLSILLKGEQSPVEIRVSQYALTRSNEGQLFLEIDEKSVETSREWLTRLVQDKIAHRKFAVPPDLAWIIELLA
jgi:hypothetical protein